MENFLDSYYSHPDFNIQSEEIRGGNAKIITHTNYDNNSVKYYFLIFDVGGDGSVASAIVERAGNLIENHNYNHIFGIRDLFPNEKEHLESIKDIFNSIFEESPISNDISLIIAVMEIETWFLAENSLFLKVDRRLTFERINEALNIDIENDDLENYRHPAKMLDDIYRIVGKRYKKKESDSHSICSKIDYAELFLNDILRARIPSFDNFVNKLDTFEG